MGKLLKGIYAVYGIIVFCIIMVIFFPFIALFSFMGRTGYLVSFYLVKVWAILYALFSFVIVKIKRSKKIDTRKSYIFVSNHTSFLDAIVIVLAIPGTVRPLGKKELGNFPLLGWVIARFGVLVDRKDKDSRKKSLENMIEVSKSGDNILVFPEGTMNRTKKPLQDFYDGAFRISKEAELDMVPVVIKNAGKLLPPSSFSLRPGKITVEVGDPFYQSEETVETLKEKSYHWILNQLR